MDKDAQLSQPPEDPPTGGGHLKSDRQPPKIIVCTEFGPKRTKPRNYEYATHKWLYKGRRPNTSAILLRSSTPKREREQPRIDSRVGLNQFFRHSRRLPIAITFDPELRLTHGLGLHEALDVLFASIMHASSGYHIPYLVFLFQNSA
ncbi:hypothetical protein PIB30_042492 [Stylosanthes scabra]|uniref:Uncharacterized protein n=1 Tax=Stylosanthes scabra TaxID=79078 RepID=A0ABU6YFV1_9FABA|nr:hypothetical protein [Stylosanthes scabra]